MQTRIEMIQNEFQKAGFQWQEHIFNDDMVKYGDCMIEFTQDKSPHAFSSFPRPKDSVGWDRFDRSAAWEMAYQWLLQKIDKESKVKDVKSVMDFVVKNGFGWQENLYLDKIAGEDYCTITIVGNGPPKVFNYIERNRAWQLVYDWLLLHKDKKIAMDTKCTQCDSLDIYDGQCMNCGNFLDGINYVQIVKYVYDENKNFPNQFESVGGNYI